MCTKCQNSYCSKCITNWQRTSSKCPFHCDSPNYTVARLVKNLLCKLNFKCKNGCNKIINYKKKKNHNEYECEKINSQEK